MSDDIEAKLAALRAVNPIRYRAGIEDIAHDAEIEASFWRACDADIEHEIRRARAERKHHERVERLMRELDEARRRREALIAAWFANVGSPVIVERVRHLARVGGPNVLDFVELKLERERRPKRRRTISRI